MIPMSHDFNYNEILFKYAMYPSTAAHGIILLMIFLTHGIELFAHLLWEHNSTHLLDNTNTRPTTMNTGKLFHNSIAFPF